MVAYTLYEEIEFRQERALKTGITLSELKHNLIMRLLTIDEQDLADDARTYSGDSNRWFGPYHVVKEIE